MNETFLSEILVFEEALLRRAFQLYNGPSEEISDLVQDTILRAVLKEDKFAKGTNLKAWLFTMMFHLFVNKHRRRKRFLEIVENHKPTLRTYTSTYTVNEHDPLSSLKMDQLIMILRDKLSRIFYEVLDFIDIQGYTYQQAADILEVPVGTVMSRLYRARRRAREILLEAYEENTLNSFLDTPLNT